MPVYFLFFLGLLAATVLLYLAAAVTAGVKRGTVPIFIRGAAANGLQAVGLALLWWNVGVCWLLALNVYPIHVDMHLLDEPALQAFTRGYIRKLPVVVLPFGLACLTWALALWSAPGRVSRRAVWAIATLCVVSVLVTPSAANALGDMQEHGFTDAAYGQLVVAHAARTLALSIAAILSLVQSQRWNSFNSPSPGSGGF